MADRYGRGSDMEGPYMGDYMKTLSTRMNSPMGRTQDADYSQRISDSVSRGYEYMMGKEAPAHLGSQSDTPDKQDIP